MLQGSVGWWGQGCSWEQREKAETSDLHFLFVLLFLNKTICFKKMSCKTLLGGQVLAPASPAAMPGAGIGDSGLGLE